MSNETVDFTPWGSSVLVTLEKPEELSDGGLHLAEVAKRPPQHGFVVAAGLECKRAEAGQRVIFALHSGKNFHLDGTDYLIMSEDSIYGNVKADSEVKL